MNFYTKTRKGKERLKSLGKGFLKTVFVTTVGLKNKIAHARRRARYKKEAKFLLNFLEKKYNIKPGSLLFVKYDTKAHKYTGDFNKPDSLLLGFVTIPRETFVLFLGVQPIEMHHKVALKILCAEKILYYSTPGSLSWFIEDFEFRFTVSEAQKIQVCTHKDV